MACETCSSLYTWTPFNDGTGRCFRYNTSPSSSSGILIELVSKTSPNYSASGTTLYSTYDTLGINIGPTTTLNNSLWKPTIGDDGPMNRSSIWTNLVGSLSVINLPINVWMGFSVCLSGLPTSSKVYYVGIGANDAYRIVLDGDEIVNTYFGPNNGTSEPYGIWHIYPVTIGTGDHTLEIYGLNIAKDAALGCEIYDNTFSELTASTSINDLNIVYSTSGETEAQIFKDLIGNFLNSGQTCPRGYYYSDCDGTCKQQIICEDISLTPTPTTSVTPTPTPTITPTTTSRSLSRFIRSCCGGILYRIIEENVLFTIGMVISIYPEGFCYTVVSNPTINERYENISVRLGYNTLKTCGDEKCQPCPTPTPTPTPSVTPNSTPIPTPTRLPEPLEPIPGETINDCGVLTLLELGIICNVINPTIDNPNGGVLSVDVTGGTAPYTIVWETPDGVFITGQTIYNQIGGDYTVTVYDKWRDFTATTVCTITQPFDCVFDGSVSVFNLPTLTPTVTRTTTPTPTITPTLTQTNTPTYPFPTLTRSHQTIYYNYLAEIRYCNNCGFNSGNIIVTSTTPLTIYSYAIPYGQLAPHSVVYKILNSTNSIGALLVQPAALNCVNACSYSPIIDNP